MNYRFAPPLRYGKSRFAPQFIPRSGASLQADSPTMNEAPETLKRIVEEPSKYIKVIVT
ncbi:MAG: hypothetical protein H8D67_29785 [Deltaproteobacteria bacterium]|nr:hypothetical protein [Deltaproteobacteria bacterium]